jgi:hypothetical protein
VYCGPTIWPDNDQGLEDLARYIIRACFSQEHMNYLPAKDSRDAQAKVIYKSKVVHIPTIETELTYDYTYSQLPPIDYWTQ